MFWGEKLVEICSFVYNVSTTAFCFWTYLLDFTNKNFNENCLLLVIISSFNCNFGDNYLLKLKLKLQNIMAPFYEWCSTASRPLRVTKFNFYYYIQHASIYIYIYIYIMLYVNNFNINFILLSCMFLELGLFDIVFWSFIIDMPKMYLYISLFYCFTSTD